MRFAGGGPPPERAARRPAPQPPVRRYSSILEPRGSEDGGAGGEEAGVEGGGRPARGDAAGEQREVEAACPVQNLDQLYAQVRRRGAPAGGRGEGGGKVSVASSPPPPLPPPLGGNQSGNRRPVGGVNFIRVERGNKERPSWHLRAGGEFQRRQLAIRRRIRDQGGCYCEG